MLRRVIRVPLGFGRAVVARWVVLSAEHRESLTKELTALREECKGQGLDLADMNDTARAASRGFQEALKKCNVDEPSVKGKCATLTASVKAYNMRLSNLQNEARSIQTEVDALLKVLWGTETPPSTAHFATPPPPSSASLNDDNFSVEPPSKAEPVVERVEGERVEALRASPSQAAAKEEEVEVETIEVEVEPEPAASSPADTMQITDITKDLYERGVNFSDCLDARSLRQRYRDVLSGRIPSASQPSKAQQAYNQPLTENANQPRMPSRNYDRPSQQTYQQPPPNQGDSGIMNDPYPNAHRKMVDPMKYVWEIKQELAAEKGIDPSGVDLWSGKVRLEDQKKLYDYPTVQSYPIEGPLFAVHLLLVEGNRRFVKVFTLRTPCLMPTIPITFEALAELNRERMKLLPIHPSENSVELSLMQMTAAVGELATLSYRHATSFSPFEREEIAAVIGKLAISLCLLGETFEVPVGQVALDMLIKDISDARITSQVCEKEVRRDDPPPLLPKHCASTSTPPSDDSLSSSPPSVCSRPSHEHCCSDGDELGKDDLRTDVHLCGGSRTPERESMRQVPGGFDTKRINNRPPSDFDILRDVCDPRGMVSTAADASPIIGDPADDGTPEVLPTPSHSAKEESIFQAPSDKGRDETMCPAAELEAPTPPSGPGEAEEDERRLQRAVFNAKVDMIKRGEARGAHIEQLGLTFSVPNGDQIVELVEDGIHVRVTATNANEFLRVLELNVPVDAVIRPVHCQTANQTTENLLPTPDDAGPFCPSHSSRDLFLPYRKPSTHLEEHNESEGSPSLSPRTRQQAPLEPLRYVDAVQKGDYHALRQMVDSIKEDPDALERFGVTFCVPSALESRSTPEEQASGMHALFPHSSLVPVRRSQHAQFLAFVQPYYHAWL